MRWLLHGPMTSAVSEALTRRGDDFLLPLDVKLSMDDPPEAFLTIARSMQLDILTTDAQTANAPFELDFWFTRVIVYLQLTGGDVEQDDAIDRLFNRYKRLTPGRLYTVTETRVKVRQLPSRREH